VVVNENGKTEGETDVDYAEEEVEEDSDGDEMMRKNWTRNICLLKTALLFC
jgi:hypothetical protein